MGKDVQKQVRYLSDGTRRAVEETPPGAGKWITVTGLLSRVRWEIVECSGRG